MDFDAGDGLRPCRRLLHKVLPGLDCGSTRVGVDRVLLRGSSQAAGVDDWCMCRHTLSFLKFCWQKQSGL